MCGKGSACLSAHRVEVRLHARVSLLLTGVRDYIFVRNALHAQVVRHHAMICFKCYLCCRKILVSYSYSYIAFF